jgi:hypothetical protein
MKITLILIGLIWAGLTEIYSFHSFFYATNKFSALYAANTGGFGELLRKAIKLPEIRTQVVNFIIL